MVTSEEISGHTHGEPMDYICPECDWRTTRHWPPPKPHCPECGDAMLRQVTSNSHEPTMTAECRCGETHEPYEGYRTCPIFNSRINVIARKLGKEPSYVLSTEKWTHPVSDEELGLIG